MRVSSPAGEGAAHDAARIFCLNSAVELWEGAEVLSPVSSSVLASWERAKRRRVDHSRVAARFVGHFSQNPLVDVSVETVLEGFFAPGSSMPCSLLSFDTQGILRVRRDGDAALASLLDQLLLLPGHDHSERWMGTTAAGLALAEGTDTTVRPWEHLHPALRCIDESAAQVVDPATRHVVGTVVAVAHESVSSDLLLPIARSLADAVSARLESEQSARSRVVMDRFTEMRNIAGAWVLGTDGEFVLSNAEARSMEAPDRRQLRETLFASFLLQDFSSREMVLPSGTGAALKYEPVLVRAELVGAVLIAMPAESSDANALDPGSRRQGAHVVPTGRRDYAKQAIAGSSDEPHTERAIIRANRDLMTPFRRASQDAQLALREGRSLLLVGEAGVGKRTLVTSFFRKSHPTGRVIRLDCASIDSDSEEMQTAEQLVRSGTADRRILLLLERINALTPATVRLVSELVRQVDPHVQLVATVDATAVDASKSYGRLLGQFADTTHIPALRFRVEEIGEIALVILRRLASGRSVRLSHQVLRILEGYAWPGNIFELEDVVKFVLQRKPVGEIQPPDLPPVCFQGRSARLSMLETAQCEAIIQALYESRGNRYRAASMLGIARSTLYRKIDAFGISYVA